MKQTIGNTFCNGYCSCLAARTDGEESSLRTAINLPPLPRFGKQDERGQNPASSEQAHSSQLIRCNQNCGVYPR